MDITSYGGWERCARLSNGRIELIAPLEIGPRVIRLGWLNQLNLFQEIETDLGKKGGEEWRLYGGHRLWHAPEEKPRTYFPDNQPVEASGEEMILVLTQEVEKTTGIQKRIILEMSEKVNRVKVTHQLWNRNPWSVEFAPWALSVMRKGGVAIVPQEPFVSHQQKLSPARPLVLWSYTDMSDPRWRWGKRLVTLRQDTSISLPTKAGFGNTLGWVGYWVEGFLLLKLFSYYPDKTYPDFGSSVEIFTNQDFLEAETLAPLSRVSPGAMVQHVEDWFLFDQVNLPGEEEAMEKTLTPLVEEAIQEVYS
ncbi:MAG: hypothetical protein PWP04_419 [Candidatus Atribacteria bacterium]|nr:hypothetical protein [Candidatus Atribacteria bacterium]